jgi:hypothetical protein
MHVGVLAPMQLKPTNGLRLDTPLEQEGGARVQAYGRTEQETLNCLYRKVYELLPKTQGFKAFLVDPRGGEMIPGDTARGCLRLGP